MWARDVLRLAVGSLCLVTCVKASVQGDLPSAAFLLIAGAWLIMLTAVERGWSNRVGLASGLETLTFCQPPSTTGCRQLLGGNEG